MEQFAERAKELKMIYKMSSIYQKEAPPKKKTAELSISKKSKKIKESPAQDLSKQELQEKLRAKIKELQDRRTTKKDYKP